jgi:acyl-CoA thioester hydrolase
VVTDRSPPRRRADFRRFSPVETRWMDNDVYGHVNNVVYYSYFDTVINRFLIAEGGLDIERGAAIGVVVASSCRYHSGLAFPQTIDAGVRVAKLGGSSVAWEVSLFVAGSDVAAADGEFVHVFVDRETRRPVAVPAAIRAAIERL